MGGRSRARRTSLHSTQYTVIHRAEQSRAEQSTDTCTHHLTPRSCSLTFESRSVGGTGRAPRYKRLQRDPGERGGSPLAARANQSERAPPPRYRRPLYHFRRREAKRILCGGRGGSPSASHSRVTPPRPRSLSLALTRAQGAGRGDWPGQP